MFVESSDLVALREELNSRQQTIGTQFQEVDQKLITLDQMIKILEQAVGARIEDISFIQSTLIDEMETHKEKTEYLNTQRLHT